MLNKVLYFLFVFIFLFLYFKSDSFANLWIQSSSMPSPLAGQAITHDSNKLIYTLNGNPNVNIGYVSLFYSYNASLDIWTQKAPAPFLSHNSGLTYYPPYHAIYACGGWHEGYLNSCFKYNISSDSWISVASMNYAREYINLMTASNGRIYAIGGNGNFHNLPVEEYNPSTNTWVIKSFPPTPVTSAKALLAPNGRIYLIGGIRHDGIGVRNVQEYNPITDTWIERNPLETPRSNYAASLNHDGNIEIIAGFTYNNFNSIPLLTASVQEYNPTSDTWSSKTNYPIAVRDLTAELANDNQVHVFGGIDDSPDLNIYSTHFTELINLSNKNLNIPLVKQTSEPWASKEYDSASIWNPTDSRIYSWGCALTSAVMVFKYYGLNNLPGNIQLDPGSLNTWLKKQKDGYIGNGSVNWLALSRLSKQLAGVNNIVSFHALEFKKIVTSDESKVIDDLKNDIPDILNVPGHFIVAKGIINDTIIINDPGFNRNSLDNYNSTFTGINKFYPSNTDLSYIMLTVQPNIDIKLKDSNNNSIGLAFLENTINNLNQNGQNNGEPLKIIFLQKPEAQNYRVELGSNYKTTYKLGIYLYDINGEVLKSEERGNLNANQKKSINFYFNGHEEIYNKKITFGKFGSDLNKSFKDNYISSALYIELNNLLSEADNLKKNKNDEECLRILSLIENLLNENISNIHPIAFSLFLYDVNYLQTHL